MYVVTISYTEGQYGDELRSIIGPYPTYDDARKAGVAFINDMDDRFGDWSAVHTWQIKPLISPSEAQTKAITELSLYYRLEERGLNLAIEYEP